MGWEERGMREGEGRWLTWRDLTAQLTSTLTSTLIWSADIVFGVHFQVRNLVYDVRKR